jgi:hypothetical protein
MPPKRARKEKKLSPEQEEEQYQAWLQSEEMTLIEQMNEVEAHLGVCTNILSINSDMTVRLDPYLEVFQKIPSVFKTKKAKHKPVTQEHIRCAFFGGGFKREEPFVIEGKEYHFPETEITQNSRNLRLPLLDIAKDVKRVGNLTAQTYQEFRKSVNAKYQSFADTSKKFMKKGKGFNVVKDYMVEMLEPLQNLLEANMGLTVIDFEYTSEIDYEVNNFKYKALIFQFCECYMKVQNIMHLNPVRNSEGVCTAKLDHSPDIFSILKKFQYKGWRTNTVERFYIQPLLDSFLKLRANMSKLYLLGFSKEVVN